MKTNEIKDLSQRQIALIAGIAFLIMTIAAGFSYGYVFGNLIVLGDAAATVEKITNSISLFRMGIFGFFITLICDVVVAWALYIFFIQENISLSLITAWLRLIYVFFLGIAISCLIFVLLLSSGGDYLELIEVHQLSAMIMLCIKAFYGVWSIGLIVFGLHLLGLGYLVLKSIKIPKIFGILLIIAALCYISANTTNILMVDYANYKNTVEMILGVPMAIGELAFAFWLLIKGGKKTNIKHF